MNLLDRMRRSLGRGPEPVVREHPLTELERQERELEKQIREKRPVPPPIDFVIEAIELFRETRRLANSRQARLVALGCIEPVGTMRYRLIEDGECFGYVLKGIENFRSHRVTFRNCYQGLLDAYLDYHPDNKGSLPEGRPNWEALRRWLARNIADIREQNGIDEAWVTEVAGHPDVFSESPVARFGEEALRGHQESFLLFRKALGIKDSSWIIDQLVLEQVHAAGRSSGSEFRRYLPGLIRLLETVTADNRMLFNKALAHILTYYHARPPLSAHKALQDFTVLHWGNPWLKRNNSGWVLVSEPVRNMVSSWLKLHYIQHFFSVLAQEGKSDPRRLKFWEKYHEAVGPLTFALGPQTRWSTDPDMVHARKLMDGLIVDLQGNGSSNNNAFIMQFGEWVVVEFGQKGNACFFFRESDLPFELNRDVSVPAVKNHIQGDSYSSRAPVRRTHRDLIEGDWETIFERVLSARGIFPGNPAASSTPTERHIATNAMPQAETRSHRTRDEVPRMQQAETRATQAQQAGKSGNSHSGSATSMARPSAHRLTSQQEAGIHALCGRLGIACEDLRSKNGNLWVFHDAAHDSRITPQLTQWGFTYRPGRGWWYKDPA
ncbi:EH signature domain-containing protein [Burkholderia pseudomallei]|uniref:EH signature domain-containing protein n=1 Tax=Burkholderia pseudomallei TaxID=28450 RepID=UPI0027DFFBD6|nr:EH signature domain-containing protein [Burkholderia pseudomallei]